MIFCNGCSKTGTHILTNICKSIERKQIGGTLVKRKPNSNFIMKGNAKIENIFSFSNNSYIHCHISYQDELEYTFARHKHLMMIRNPRNLAISWMRHRVKQNPSLTESTDLLNNLISGGMFGESIPTFYKNFFGWLKVKNIHVIKFEEIVKRNHDLSTTEEYLALKSNTLDYDRILGDSSTFTGNHSSWESWWTDETESAWVQAGGIEADEFINRYYKNK